MAKKNKESNDNADDMPSGSGSPDDVLSFEEAMKFLDTSQPTLYRLLKQGAVQGLKVGRQWRFRRADLVAYMERKPATLSQAGHGALDEEVAFFRERLGRDLVRPEAETPEQAKVGSLVNGILSVAIEEGASDIHLEAKNDGVLLRQRVDGVLHEVRYLPLALHALLVQRFKEMADMDPLEKRVPQDGRIHLKYQNRRLDGRVASLPSAYGEAITIRILDQSHITLEFERLGLAADDEARVKKWLEAPNGLILITGPTGSGKTTVLYTLLTQVTGPQKKTLTIEDPVEYYLPHTSQTHVNRKAGLTFATALRAFLRSDPDVIMVGEVRDLETIQGALQAALTGHLVLSTLHTDDTASTITRLLDLGVEPFLLSAALLGITSQRLVRRVCDGCREKYQPAPEILKKAREAAKSGGYDMPRNVKFSRGRGCAKCRKTGYRGRVAIYEALSVNEALADAIVRRAPTGELCQIALQSGMTSLFADGVRKAVAGVTTLDEVMRVTGGR
jgi:excisionase family DNA binding protein